MGGRERVRESQEWSGCEDGREEAKVAERDDC